MPVFFPSIPILTNTSQDAGFNCSNASADPSTSMTTFVESSMAQSSMTQHTNPRGIISQPALQDLRQYFERPRLVANGVLPTTRGNFYSSVIDQTWLASAFPDFSARVSGCTAYRFDVTFHLQCSATPFHQGLICMAFQPGSAFARTDYTFSHTDLPHTRMDISSESMAVLETTFTSASEFFPVGPNFVYGRFAACCLTPTVIPPSSTGATYNLYASIHNLQLFGARPTNTTTLTLQGPMDDEAQASQTAISSRVSQVSTILKMVSNVAPSLSTFSQPLSWFLDATSGALRSYGFSKPPVVGPFTRVIGSSGAQEGNIDQPTPLTVLGPYSTNRIAVDDTVSGSSIDQMALDYVLSRPSQIFVGDFSTSTARGSIVYGVNTSPRCLWWRFKSTTQNGNVALPDKLNSDAVPLKTTVKPSNIMYFASMFRHWRGCLVFRVTFAKTSFHTGRLLACFIPTTTATLSAGSSIITPNSASFGTGYTAIFDLKEGNVIEFECPYLMDMPHLTFSKGSGSFSIQVLDPLLAPSTVSPTVPFMVEVYAKDFTLSCPTAPVFPPATSRVSYLYEQCSDLPIVYEQSGALHCNYTPSVEEVTSGESVCSLKQLIMLPKRTWQKAYNEEINILLPPWFFGNRVPDSYSGLPISDTLSFGHCIAQCYAFVRGSTDYHIYGSGVRIATVTPYDRGSYTPGVTWVDGSVSNMQSVTAFGSEPLHLKAPYYGRTARIEPSLILHLFADNATMVDGNVWSAAKYSRCPGTAFPYPPLTSNFLNSNLFGNNGYLTLPDNFVVLNPGNSETIVARSAGDDAYASFFLGVPPVFVGSGGSFGSKYDPDFPVAGYSQVNNPISTLDSAVVPSALAVSEPALFAQPISSLASALDSVVEPVDLSISQRNTLLTVQPPPAPRPGETTFVRHSLEAISEEMRAQ